MKHATTKIRTTIRIPGNWSHPRELVDRIPPGYRLTSQWLIMPDGTKIEFTPMPPDTEFGAIFRTACREPATDEELEVIDGYTANVILTGPGGSMAAATTMLQAGAAIARAGGAGVFIDNSGVAHGGQRWIELAESGGPDALSFAFVCIVGGRGDLWTAGMHVLGLPDVMVARTSPQVDSATIISVILHLCHSYQTLADGDVLADENGPRFRAVTTTRHTFEAGSPIHNPFGRLQMVSMKEIAENN